MLGAYLNAGVIFPYEGITTTTPQAKEKCLCAQKYVVLIGQCLWDKIIT